MPEDLVASLRIEVNLHADGTYEVVIPDEAGGEYARTFSTAGAYSALGQAGQYVEDVMQALVRVPETHRWEPFEPRVGLWQCTCGNREYGADGQPPKRCAWAAQEEREMETRSPSRSPRNPTIAKSPLMEGF